MVSAKNIIIAVIVLALCMAIGWLLYSYRVLGTFLALVALLAAGLKIFSSPVLWGMFLLLVQFLVRFPRNIFGHEYWTTYWALNYSLGFQKRSFIGNLLIPLGGLANDYWFIAVLSWAAMLFLWFLLVKIIIRFFGQIPGKVVCLFLTIFLLSPAWTGVLIEVVGDHLQLIFAVFIFLLFKSSGKEKLGKGLMAAWVVFGFTASFIHESSMFFILPALVLAGFEWPELRKVFWICLLGALVAFIPVSLWGTINSAWKTRVLDFPGPGLTGGHRQFIECNDFFQLSLKEVVRYQEKYFWSRGLIFNFRHLVGALALPLMQAWVISSLYCFALGKSLKSGAIGGIWFRWYVLPLIALLPVFVMANDWGRFAGYSLMLQTAALFLGNHKSVPVKESFFSEGLTGLRAQFFLCCLLLVICTSPFLQYYRLWGLSSSSSSFWRTSPFLIPAGICWAAFIYLIFKAQGRR